MDNEKIEKICKIWYTLYIKDKGDSSRAMQDAFELRNQIDLIFKDNQEERAYAMGYFEKLLKGEINEENSGDQR